MRRLKTGLEITERAYRAYQKETKAILEEELAEAAAGRRNPVRLGNRLEAARHRAEGTASARSWAKVDAEFPPDAVSSAAALLGRKGGSRHTPAQVEALKKGSLMKGGGKGWPKGKARGPRYRAYGYQAAEPEGRLALVDFYDRPQPGYGPQTGDDLPGFLGVHERKIPAWASAWADGAWELWKK